MPAKTLFPLFRNISLPKYCVGGEIFCMQVKKIVSLFHAITFHFLPVNKHLSLFMALSNRKPVIKRI